LVQLFLRVFLFQKGHKGSSMSEDICLDIIPQQVFALIAHSNFLVFAVLGFELKVHPLSHSTSLFLCWVFSRKSLVNYLPRLALNLNPPDLCLLNSWDYRREPPAPGCSPNCNTIYPLRSPQMLSHSLQQLEFQKRCFTPQSSKFNPLLSTWLSLFVLCGIRSLYLFIWRPFPSVFHLSIVHTSCVLQILHIAASVYVSGLHSCMCFLPACSFTILWKAQVLELKFVLYFRPIVIFSLRTLRSELCIIFWTFHCLSSALVSVHLRLVSVWWWRGIWSLCGQHHLPSSPFLMMTALSAPLCGEAVPALTICPHWAPAKLGLRLESVFLTLSFLHRLFS
jgi:hypothetical protein